MKQEVIREALIHFELYRHLKNILLSESRFNGVTYKIEPEVPVQGKSADLMIFTETEGSAKPFLVIEVKRKIKGGFSVFDDDAFKQAQNYAKKLVAPYFAITDGEHLRFFKIPEQHIGDYRFSLDQHTCRRLLQDLTELKTGGNSGLSFPKLKNPMEELINKSNTLVKELTNLFDKLSRRESIEKVVEGRVLGLNINVNKILRLNLSDQPNGNILDIRLEELRTAVGSKFPQVMEELSKVPGFNWIREEVDISMPNTWRPIKKLITEEPDPKKVVRYLRQWILELEKLITSQNGPRMPQM